MIERALRVPDGVADVTTGLSMSVVSGVLPGASRRRRALLARQHNPLRRAATTVVHEIVTRIPHQVGQVLGLELTAEDVEYVGMGLQSLVIRSGPQSVVKVLQRTMAMPASAQEELVRRYEVEYRALRENLSDFIVDQVVYVDVHPMIANRQVVQIQQPFLHVVDCEIFPSDTATTMARRVAELEATNRGTTTRLRDFLKGSRRLRTNHGLLPDINAGGNLVLDRNGHLLLIDSIPIPASRPELQQRVTEQLDLLEAATLVGQ